MGIFEAAKDVLGIFDDLEDFYNELSEIKARRDRILGSLVNRGEDIKEQIKAVKSQSEMRFVSTYVRTVFGTSKSINSLVMSDLKKLEKLKIKARKNDLTDVLDNIRETESTLKKMLIEHRTLLNKIRDLKSSWGKVSRKQTVATIVRFLIPPLLSVLGSLTAYKVINQGTSTTAPKG